MWKKFFNFAAVVLAAVTVIGLSSCKDKVYYSCDPTINKIIKQNLPYYENMTREEWKTLPDSLKDAAFVAMTPETKKEFWRGKQKEMISAKFFSDSEKKQISKLYNYLLSIDYIYTNKYKDDSQEMQGLFEYYKEWAFYGIDNLKWDVIDIFLIAEDKEELTEDYIEHVKTNSEPATGLSKPKCNCRYDIGCRGGGNCDNKECSETNWGCGPAGIWGCTRKCTDPFVINGQVVNVTTYSDQKELFLYMLK